MITHKLVNKLVTYVNIVTSEQGYMLKFGWNLMCSDSVHCID